jgi:hypothetical protein
VGAIADFAALNRITLFPQQFREITALTIS